MKQKKIVIIGGFGWQDIGDEAMPQTVIYNLRQRISNLDIVMLSPNPTYTSAYHNERSINDVNGYLHKRSKLFWLLTSKRLGILAKIARKLFPAYIEYAFRWVYFLLAAWCQKRWISLPIDKVAKAILNELSNADLLFNNGGGNINTLLYDELYKQTLTILAASLMRVPIILSGQTIGPVTKKLHACVVRWALNRVDTITLRDKGISKQRLASIGVQKPKIIDTADDAIGLPFLDREKTTRLIIENEGYEWLHMPADIIAVINMNGYLKAMGKNNIDEMHKEVALLSRVSDKLVDDFRAKILLVPTDYHRDSDDRPLLRQVKDSMKHPTRALIIEREYDAIQYKSLIGLCDLAIGARYHFVVFATSMGVPCIGMANGIYQKTKLQGIMDLYGLPECFIKEDMETVEHEAMGSIVKHVIENKEQISRQLKERTLILHRQSMLTILRAEAVCNKR